MRSKADSGIFLYWEILILLENTTCAPSQCDFVNHEILTFTPVGVADSLQFVIHFTWPTGRYVAQTLFEGLCLFCKGKDYKSKPWIDVKITLSHPEQWSLSKGEQNILMSSLFTDDKFVENCFLGILWQQSEWHPTFKEENKMEFEYWRIGHTSFVCQ